MNLFSFSNDRISLLWACWFVVCLTPFSIEGGYSANYLFLITPLIYLTVGKKLYYPPQLLIIFFGLCTVIFIFAILYQVNYLKFYQRRFISFILFLSIFSLSTMDFSSKMISSFFFAICFMSVFLSLQQTIKFFYSGEIDPNILRGVTGTQRFGFLYIFSLWIFIGILFSGTISKLQKFIFVLLLVIVLCGLLLSLSRSGYFGFLGSVFVSFLPVNSSRASKKIYLRAINYFPLVLISALVLFFFMPILTSYYNDRISFLFSVDYFIELFQNTDHESSEGYRILMWQTVLDYVISNPFTGSGYLGIWAISGWNTSAHSEFFDRFLKIGFIGFFLYIIILFRLLFFLRKKYLYLFYGFFSALIIGISHETFSLSYGSCIFSFLLMLYSMSNRHKNCSNFKNLEIRV